MPFGVPDAQWNAAKDEVRVTLVGIARRRTVTTYGELTENIQAFPFRPEEHRFHCLLGEISTEEDSSGRRMLSAVVVHKNPDRIEGEGGFTMPGIGFFKLAVELGREPCDSEIDRLELWAREVGELYNYWETH